MFQAQGIEMLIAQSYSKNFGLYGERIGALSFVTQKSEGELNAAVLAAEAIQSQIKKVVRCERVEYLWRRQRWRRRWRAFSQE